MEHSASPRGSKVRCLVFMLDVLLSTTWCSPCTRPDDGFTDKTCLCPATLVAWAEKHRGQSAPIGLLDVLNDSFDQHTTFMIIS
jgi:hypothetical protein